MTRAGCSDRQAGLTSVRIQRGTTSLRKKPAFRRGLANGSYPTLCFPSGSVAVREDSAMSARTNTAICAIATPMNSSKALAIAFAAFIGCLPVSGAAKNPPQSHSRQKHLYLHRQAPTALPASGTQTPSLGMPTFQKSATRPLVTNDSDGLSRDPEDCNRGCLDSAE